MKIPVHIGYYQAYQHPQSHVKGYHGCAETVDLNLPEASESELVPYLDVFQEEKGYFQNFRFSADKNPWDVIKTRVYLRLVNGAPVYYRLANAKDVKGDHNFAATVNPFRHLCQKLINGRDFVSNDVFVSREEMIEKAKKYLESFLLVDHDLYKVIAPPMWNVQSAMAEDNAKRFESFVRVSLELSQEHGMYGPGMTDAYFPWTAKNDAMEFAKAEAIRVGAETVMYSDMECVNPVLKCLTCESLTKAKDVLAELAQEICRNGHSEETVREWLYDAGADDELCAYCGI